MAVAIAWLPGPAGTRRRVAKPSVEEPDAAEPARPDLWGARVSNDPGLPDHEQVTLRWRAPANDGGDPITDYEYEQNSDGTWTSTGPRSRDLPARHDRFPRSPRDHPGRLNECLDI